MCDTHSFTEAHLLTHFPGFDLTAATTSVNVCPSVCVVLSCRGTLSVFSVPSKDNLRFQTFFFLLVFLEVIAGVQPMSSLRQSFNVCVCFRAGMRVCAQVSRWWLLEESCRQIILSVWSDGVGSF